MLLLHLSMSCNKASQKRQPISAAPVPPANTTTQKPLIDHDPFFTPNPIITSEEGPKSITRNILEDRQGNIWLATWEGIIKYDYQEETFTNFTNKENLRRFHVFCIHEDRNGNIWFGSIGAGIYFYDGKTFTNLTSKDGLANDSVGCIYEDRSGNIWIGTQNGISCIKEPTKSGSAIQFTNYFIEGYPENNDINSIIEDQQGLFWIGTRGETHTFDGTSFSRVLPPEGRAFANVRTIIEDQSGHIWLAGNDGLWQHTTDGYKNYNTNFVGYVYEDRQGNIWMSAETPQKTNTWELAKIKYQTLQNGKTNYEVIKREENMFFGIREDRRGAVWLGTLRGVYRFDGNQFVDFTEN